jgi:small subunit ribosomal protein S6
MTRQYETVIIFSPLLSEDDVKRQAKRYTKYLTDNGCTIIDEINWGMRPMAYSIKGKTNGIYHILEFNGPGELIAKLETEFRRDENVLRYLTIELDKHAMDYNDRKRKGLIGQRKPVEPVLPPPVLKILTEEKIED